MKMFRLIHEDERALVFKNGRLERILMPGKHWNKPGRICGVCRLNEEIQPQDVHTTVELLLENPMFEGLVDSVALADHEIAAHYQNGRYVGVLYPGVHAFWKAAGRHEFRTFDRTNPEPVEEMSREMWKDLESRKDICARFQVSEGWRGLLMRDGGLDRVLEPGVYSFWTYPGQLSFIPVDMRLQEMPIQGQELLTQDKVEVRLNFVISYRIQDPVRLLSVSDSYMNQLRVAGQLALREFVSRCKLDELLDSREQLTAFVLARLQDRAESLAIEVSDAGVRDIILPGSVREIMNTVLVAEKRAQANVIARREEVASTRSLLNTAKLMDENKTLYRLKELEALERIVEKVGSINVSGSGDLLTQLSGMLKGTKMND